MYAIVCSPNGSSKHFVKFSVISVKSHGAKGDGKTDDTRALQSILDTYSSSHIIFFDAGTYRISSTLTIPVGSRIVGEMWSTILLDGHVFNDSDHPVVGVRVGKEGDVGLVEISDLVFTTVAGSAGAIVLQINVRESYPGAVGIWDTHVRLGGAIGTRLTVKEAAKLQGHGKECTAAFLAVHINKCASAYLEVGV